MTRADHRRPPWPFSGVLAGALVLVGATVTVSPPAAYAAGTTISVTGTAESSTITPCTTSCLTLRDAAAEANSLATRSGSPVTIVLPAGTTDVTDGYITLGSTTNLDFTLTGPDSNAADAVLVPSGSTVGQGTLQTPPEPGRRRKPPRPQRRPR